MNVRELEPHGLWEIFADVCSIPHPSGHEARLRDYVLEFARLNKLSAQCDAAGNVLLAKPAAPGCENFKTVLMQGHLDMVSEKNTDYDFDFLTQPIQPVIAGDLIKAENTTLGADNGIGIALALMVMTDEKLQHGPLRALFTIEEETGLTGANQVDPAFIDADIMLNLDSEDEGQLFIGCAGGARVDFTFKPEHIEIPAEYKFVEIAIAGLLGGHSGCDIHRGRGNAIKEAAALLDHLFAELSDLYLVEVQGGDKDNAIPREAFTRLAVPKHQLESLKQLVTGFAASRFNENDPGLKFDLKPIAYDGQVLSVSSAQSLINALDTCPDGVIAASNEFPGVIETSTNLASVKNIAGKIVILTSQRSLVDAERIAITDTVIEHFTGFGAEAQISSKYPGWTPRADSEILKIAAAAYHRQSGKAPEIVVIHAGLECGIIGKKHPGVDMISLGPDIIGPHAPGECVSISSTVRCLDLLKDILSHIPEKN
jgi:dipeptidase D